MAYAMPALFLLLNLLVEDLLTMACPAQLKTVAERPRAAKIFSEAATANKGRSLLAPGRSWHLLALLTALLTRYGSGITRLWPPSVLAASAVAC